MRVLLVCCKKEPRIVNVPHELAELQRLVGGMIEVVEPFNDDIALVCNENGRSDGKPVNRIINDQMDICGDFFLCRYGETGLEEIPEEKVFKYASMFSLSNNDNHPQRLTNSKPWYEILH